jgi:serine/threonine-protein kinase
VVRVSDVGKLEDGTPFMVMELLNGKDLGSVAEQGALAASEAAALLLQACEGLAEAHSMGILHRDLKPRNLFLTCRTDGSPLVKVLDFGLAKPFDPAVKDSGVTGSVKVVGSPPYMSPEQIRGEPLDVRSDVWSLGICFFELLTGRLPFDGANVPAMCARILRDTAPPITEYVPTACPDVQALLDRCLAKAPGDRFADVAELAAALEPIAPPSAHGSARRVEQVLSSPLPVLLDTEPPPAPEVPVVRRPELETRTAFDSVGQPRSRVARPVAIAAVSLVAALLVASLLRSGRPGPASAVTAATVSAIPSTSAAPPASDVQPPLPAATASDTAGSAPARPRQSPPFPGRSRPKTPAAAHPESTRM